MAGREKIKVTGMILSVRNVGEADRRLVLLTRERGKMTVFANRSRRQGSPLLGPTASPFVFGSFFISEGARSDALLEARIDNYFEKLRTDYTGVLYGLYFMEVLEYITRENNDETLLLLLGYQALRALESDRLDDRLVRSVFEIKSVILEGEYPGMRPDVPYSEAAAYAIRYVERSSIAKLFSFGVKETVLHEMERFSSWLMGRTFGHTFTSLEALTAWLPEAPSG